MASITELAQRRGQLSNAPEMVGLTDNAERDMPWWYNAWQKWPSATAMMGFSTWRGTNTILHGGWSPGALPTSTSPWYSGQSSRALWERTKLRYNPRSSLRFSSMERMAPGGASIFDPTATGWRTPTNPAFKSSHGMFQMGPALNYAATRASRIPGVGSLPVFRGLTPGQSIISGGFWSTQNAAYSISRQAAISPTRAANVAQYMRISNPALYNSMGGAGFSGLSGSSPMAWSSAAQNLSGMTGLESSQVLAMSGRGTWNQFAGGAIAGSRGMITNAAAGTIGEAAGTGFMATAAGRGATWAASTRALGGLLPGEAMGGASGFIRSTRLAMSGQGVKVATAKFLAKEGMEAAGREVVEAGLGKATALVGRKLAVQGGKRAGIAMGARFAAGAGITAATGGAAAPFVAAALTAWTVYDLAKVGASLASSAVSAAVQFEKDAATSFMGGINKAPMSGYRGQGFVDNSVAMTSRQRGVQAIQNSRLNARNVLGSEAPLMSGHFG